MKAIEEGQTLKARSVCDYECEFTAKVIERKGNFVKVLVNDSKEVKRVKVHTDYSGQEIVYAMGKYSMCPIFKAV